jgi:hypothetical protein
MQASLSTVIDELKAHLERLDGRDEVIARLEQSVAGLNSQMERLGRELRTINEGVAVLKQKESQLRAIVERDSELELREPALAAMMAREDIGRSIVAAIENTTLHLDPFPWMVVDDLFPQDVYDALVEGIPPVEVFGDKPTNKQQIKVPFDMAPSYSRRVWRYMSHVLAPQFITPGITGKLRVPLTAWIRENWPMLGDDPLNGRIRLHSTDGRILLRRRGYRIPPHRDPKWGFLTCILYLARPGDSDEWGTQFYTVDEDAEARGSAPHWIDPAKCRLVKDVKFRRNRALVFLNSVGAHGASIPADAEPEDLERYIYQFRIGPTGKFIKEMTEILPDERRPYWAGKLPADY